MLFAVSYAVSLRVDDGRLADDSQLLLRLGTDRDVDQTIKASLGHYLSYSGVLRELGMAGAGALTLSVYVLESERSPLEFRAGPFQRAYRTTTVARVREAEVPIWATDVAVEGRPLPNSADHFDLVVSTAEDVLPDAYAAAGKAERRRLRELLRPRFELVLAIFDPPRPFETSGGTGPLDPGGA
jgi:hypothetical protein